MVKHEGVAKPITRSTPTRHPLDDFCLDSPHVPEVADIGTSSQGQRRSLPHGVAEEGVDFVRFYRL